jgi:hypothetical protein
MPQAVVRSEHGKRNYADVWSLHVGVALRKRGTVDATVPKSSARRVLMTVKKYETWEYV